MDLTVFDISIVIAHYPWMGWVPIGLKAGQEVYRGEYRPTPEEALAKGMIWLDPPAGGGRAAEIEAPPGVPG